MHFVACFGRLVAFFGVLIEREVFKTKSIFFEKKKLVRRVCAECAQGVRRVLRVCAGCAQGVHKRCAGSVQGVHKANLCGA